MNIEDLDDDGLLADLDAALDAGKPVAEAPVEGETAEQQEAREYIRDGRRFVPKPKAEEAKAEAEAPEPVAAEGEKPAEPAKPAWKPTWYKNEYGEWDKLPEPFRNALRDQERNAAQAIEKHSTSAKAWEPISKALEPYAHELAASGSSPQQFIGQLIDTAKYLQADPVKAIDYLCRQYLQCDVIALANWMDQQGIQPEKVDPVQQELAALKKQVMQLTSLPQQQERERVNAEIAAWAKDKPDFAAVQPVMAAIAKQKPDASLDEWYEQARWAHPEIRQSILKEQEDKRLAELRGKKAAGATSPRAGFNGEAPRNYKNMTLEEEIAANL